MSNTSEQFMEALQEWARIFMRRSTFGLLAFAKEQNLSKTQIGTIFMLRKKETCGVSEIGGLLNISNAAASQMLERLVQQGIIQRIEDPSDRRAKLISLTEKGEQLVQEGYKAHKRWMEELASTLPPEEQRQITQALRLLLDHTSESDIDEFEDYWHDDKIE